jgi:hypothetical protein
MEDYGNPANRVDQGEDFGNKNDRKIQRVDSSADAVSGYRVLL